MSKDRRDERKKGCLFGFGIGDCPVWLYQKFDALAKKKYSNVYWVTLAEIMTKAEAYDAFIASGAIEEGIVEDDEPEAEELPQAEVPKKPLTMDGAITE